MYKRQVYLAPDDELINVPFDLLYDEKKIRIADRHNCIKIECARDFLFETMESSGSKATLIVGSPEYEVRERRTELEREKTEETGRDRKMDLDTVEKLPFSKVEAYRISVSYTHLDVYKRQGTQCTYRFCNFRCHCSASTRLGQQEWNTCNCG